MNAPTLVASAAVAAGTAAVISAQEVAASVGAGRSTAEIIQIIGAVSAAATVIGAVIVQIITARIKVAVANAVAPIAVAVADVDVKAGAIKASVDGTASRMEATLAAALRENERLVKAITDQKEIILAQIGAPGGSAPSGGTAAEASLEQIEAHTDATAKNTAKTDATVTELKKER